MPRTGSSENCLSTFSSRREILLSSPHPDFFLANTKQENLTGQAMSANRRVCLKCDSLSFLLELINAVHWQSRSCEVRSQADCVFVCGAGVTGMVVTEKQFHMINGMARWSSEQ